MAYTKSANIVLDFSEVTVSEEDYDLTSDRSNGDEGLGGCFALFPAFSHHLCYK